MIGTTNGERLIYLPNPSGIDDCCCLLWPLFISDEEHSMDATKEYRRAKERRKGVSTIDSATEFKVVSVFIIFIMALAQFI